MKRSPEHRLAAPLRLLGNVYRFYADGFRQMTVGRLLWAIILVKLFLFFVVIKLLFFPHVLNTRFDTDVQRADHVAGELLRPVAGSEP